MPNLTERLVDLVLGVTYDALPTAAIITARSVSLDGIGVTLAGATEPLGVGRHVTSYVHDLAGAPQATVVGGGFKTSITEAAFANGTMAHALDFDNTWYPMNHPTSPTLPAILAVAEYFGIDGKSVVSAIVAAFEVQARLRMACRGLHTGKGFHKPGTVGIMGATAATAALLELSPEQAVMAFGLAGSRAGSLSVNTGTMTKASHSGHAARMGVEAALMARKGWTASSDVFGPGGFFDAFVGQEQDPDLLVQDFGSPFRLVDPGVGFKRYPCNYFTHRGIDAALAIRAQEGFDPRQIDSVRIDFPCLAYVNRPRPETGLDGKFSVQYTAAVALLDGAVDIDTFTNERRFKSDIDDLLQRVHIEFDENRSAEFDRMHVDVTAYSNGREYTARVEQLDGMPGVPVKTSQLLTKFRTCAGRVLQHDEVEKLADLLLHIDELDNVTEILDIARGQSSANIT